MSGLIHQVRNTIRQQGMLPGGATVVCAVSGGVDSVVLLHVLLVLRAELGIERLIVAHMDHGLRGAESRRDFAFVRALAKRLGCEFISRRLGKGEVKALGGSPQDAARRLRYAFLEEAASGRDVVRVALGHNRDDQAETVLMRLMKGASLAGLSGIPPVRGQFIRPLIQSSRADIEAYARAHGLVFVTDSTNLTAKYLRNSVRLELIPFIEKRYNPAIKETLARTTVILSEDGDFLESAAMKAHAAALVGTTTGDVVLDRKRLVRLHPAMLSRVFFMAVRSLGVDGDLGAAHAASFAAVLAARRPNASIDLPGGITVRREYDRVSVSLAGEPEAISEVALEVPGSTFVAGAGLIESKIVRPPVVFDTGPGTAWFDYDALVRSGQVRVRGLLPGDRMTLLGMKGSRKLKDIFIDLKVAPSMRRKTPVVVAGDGIIWLAGVRQSALFSVTKGTKMALRMVFIKDEPGPLFP